MPIITSASTKGGPGKTTLSLCLADHWRRAGHRVELLDVDPNRNLTQWVKAAGAPITCTTVDEDDIIEAATAAEQRADWVVIDVAGVLARGLVHAIGIANAVVIPCRPDLKDALEAARTYQHVVAEQRMAQRRDPNARIPAAAVLMQVNRRAQAAGFAREQLSALKVPLLDADIPLRVAYQNYSFAGLPLDDAAVRGDFADLAAAIDRLIHG
ncbi:ParA family protein [Azospirillum picis]|uniref:Chromosome partitioning protein n=1 Tax=Azospirillum picis TaxID=488438 RepID=A0ABU0MT32_9PROT|nr:ParA family protein [Azospirillum picis]MBP2302728.1 chromosome partitioning protein [Azospirillum picis]MDQ0536479.1 chromosome partitioning protein [Azospirillum picis]